MEEEMWLLSNAKKMYMVSIVNQKTREGKWVLVSWLQRPDVILVRGDF